MKRETWITGVGILSCLGEGPKAHWQALTDGKINFDAAGFPPYIVHPLPPMSFDARIAAGQSDIALVGGAQNSERKEMLMLYEFGGFALKGAFHPVWGRAAHPGFALGSMGAFLVLEATEHARARGAKPLARLAAVL